MRDRSRLCAFFLGGGSVLLPVTVRLNKIITIFRERPATEPSSTAHRRAPQGCRQFRQTSHEITRKAVAPWVNPQYCKLQEYDEIAVLGEGSLRVLNLRSSIHCSAVRVQSNICCYEMPGVVHTVWPAPRQSMECMVHTLGSLTRSQCRQDMAVPLVKRCPSTH